MKNVYANTFTAWRFYSLIIFIFIIVVALLARIIDLTFFKHQFLLEQGNARVLRIMDVPAYRGMITDRNGHPLAISTSVYSVWVDPNEKSISSESIKSICKILNLSQRNLLKEIQQAQKKHKEFLYVKRAISPELAAKIKTLKLPGFYLQQENKRFYPEGEIASHLIGFTNVDDKGQEGIELAYNNWLQGENGRKLVLKDRVGRIISEIKTLQSQVSGKDIALSIDSRIQYLTYRELAKGVHENKAIGGSAIVLDVKTGEILAMANQPSFNPNNRMNEPKDHFRNRAVTDLFEPGSTIKAFSVAAALASGMFTPNTIIDTYPGWLRVGHNIVKDEHRKGPMNLTEILEYSSNVGITKLVLSIPPDHLWNLLHAVGFGQAIGIGLPGERQGELKPRKNWAPFALATLSFGYGLSVTTLQLAQAYSIIANEGRKIPLTILKNNPSESKQIIDRNIALEMRNLLGYVTAKGATGEKAALSGYTVAGKTGTAIKNGPNGYIKNHHVASFVGMAPASDPRLIVVVVIDDPQGKNYYGGLVAGPIFKQIMENTLRILNIAPDNMVESKS